MVKEKFTNATVFYNCSGEERTTFCTNKNLARVVGLFKRCSWIKDIEVIKYDFS